MTGDKDELTADAFKLIKDLSQEELVAEILEDFRNDLVTKDIETLRHHVIHLRRDNYTQRLMREAGFDPDNPPCNGGGFIVGG